MTKCNGKTVLITGASSGLGAELALQIAHNRGFPILLARSEEKLKQIQQKILQETDQLVPFYVTDITKFEELRRVISSILLEYPTLDVLINNAGFGVFRSFIEAPIEEFERMIKVNYLGSVQCTKLILPHMIERRNGHIINVASQSGKIGTPKSSAYAASKYALLGFTNSLRLEVKRYGIHVSAINPGPIRTPFFDRADVSGTYTQRVDRLMLTPERVAERIVCCIRKPVREVNLPFWMEAGSRLFTLAPSIMERLLGEQLNKK